MRQLQKFELLKHEGGLHWSITNLAAILFARRLDAFGAAYERKAPRVVFYAGDDRIRTTHEQTGVKGYALGFKGIADFLELILPKSEQLEGVLRRNVPVYPLVAIRELLANALVHQDFSLKGSGPMIEVFESRIEIGNPGAPLIDVDRLLDEARSRNEALARAMRRIGFCEERGSGIDKVVSFAEVYQLPPPEFTAKSKSFLATLHGPRAYGDMTADERIRACYQHACLLWVAGGKSITNTSLRERFGLGSQRTATISRIFADAIDRGLIKPADPGNKSRSQAAYVPYWA